MGLFRVEHLAVYGVESREDAPELILYVSDMCAACENVIAAAEDLGLYIDQRNIADPEHRAELHSHGGRVQVPYLIDITGNVAMYESEEIIRYLERKYPRQDDA